MSLNSDDIRMIVDALEKSEWDQAAVSVGDTRISVARNGMPLDGQPVAAPSTVAATPAPTVPQAASPTAPSGAVEAAPAPTGTTTALSDETADGVVIESPSVGVFWRAPQPGAAPFVEVGSKVKAGDTVGIVEVMKLMNYLAADVAGEVVAIHGENAGAVEYGSPLVTIRAEG